LEPEEEGFVYRTRRDSGMDPAMRRMALGAGGLSVLVIAVALLWSGVRGTGFGPPPVITAPPGPLRVAPANPGGLTVPEANVPIMSGVASVAPPQLAPSQASPDVSQLDQEAGIGVPPPPPVLKSGPSVDLSQLDQAAGVSAAAPAASNGVAVQLASIGSQPGAQEIWSVLQQKMPDLLGHRSADIVPAVVNGQTVWRLRVGGFADLAAAKDFCATLRARHAACIVASF
jgi:SPOR domain